MRATAIARATAVALALAMLVAGAGCAGPAHAAVEYRADEQLFTLYVALSSARFRGVRYDPLLAQRPGSSAAGDGEAEVVSFLAAHPFHIAQYVNYVLSLSGPPAFDEGEFTAAPLPELSLQGFNSVLERFYREAEVHSLWLQSRPQQEAALDRLRSIVPPALAQVDRSLAVRNRRKVIVIPALLDVPGRGYGVVVGDVAYLVLSPPADDEQLTKLVKHEYMHVVVNPLCDAHAELEAQCGEAYRDRLAFLAGEALPPEAMGFLWRSLFRESLVQTLSLYVEGTPIEERIARLEALEQQGCFFVREIDACIEKAGPGRGPVDEMILGCLRCLQSQEHGSCATGDDWWSAQPQ